MTKAMKVRAKVITFILITTNNTVISLITLTSSDYSSSGSSRSGSRNSGSS